MGKVLALMDSIGAGKSPASALRFVDLEYNIFTGRGDTSLPAVVSRSFSRCPEGCSVGSPQSYIVRVERPDLDVRHGSVLDVTLLLAGETCAQVAQNYVTEL